MLVRLSSYIKTPPPPRKWFCLASIFPGASEGKESACNAGGLGSVPGSGRPLEEGMATHSSVLVGRTPWTEEPGGLQTAGLQRAGHD